MSVVGTRFELGSVDFLVEVASPIFGNAVETTVDLLEETILGELPGTSTGVIGDRAAKMLDCARSEVPLFSNQFENSVVCGNHPLRRLAHCTRVCGNVGHISTDDRLFDSTAYQYVANSEQTLYTPDYTLSNSEQELYGVDYNMLIDPPVRADTCSGSVEFE